MGGLRRPTRSGSNRWREESEALREILVGCGLDEAIKWGKPCYSVEGKNVAIIQRMKAFLALMFFKGSLLEDPDGALRSPGPNSNAARRFELASLREVLDAKDTIERYVREAIEIERADRKVPKAGAPALPDELVARFARAPSLEAAFEALTPGRQRGYSIYFSAAKSAEARERRIDKYAPKILDGKGFHDR